MGKVLANIDTPTEEFLRRQHLFFVATAPLSAAGHINLSPKGHDTFAILDPLTVVYLDLNGSGIETVAHIKENGRIVLMFCAFDGPPKIVRLHGDGEVIEPGDEEFGALRARFDSSCAARSVVRVRVTRISDSCGYSVPLYDFVGERDQLLRWAERKGDEGLRVYQQERNALNIDGLPGLRRR